MTSDKDNQVNSTESEKDKNSLPSIFPHTDTLSAKYITYIIYGLIWLGMLLFAWGMYKGTIKNYFSILIVILVISCCLSVCVGIINVYSRIKKTRRKDTDHISEKIDTKAPFPQKPAECIKNLNHVLYQLNTIAHLGNSMDYDVRMGYSDIQRNIQEAVWALEKGRDVTGKQISPQNVGHGLKMLWANFGIGWIDIIASRMRPNEHSVLQNVLDDIKRISEMIH